MFIIQEVMKRRRVLVAAGLCLSFFLGTWMNLLSEPGFEHQQVESYHEKQTRHRDTGDSQLHVGESLGAETITGSSTREPEAPGSLHELQLQIRERYDEVLRYRRIQAHRPGQRDLGRPLERRRLMDLEPGDNWNPARAKGWTVHRQVHRNPAASTATRAAPHGRAPHGVNGAPLLGCSSIRDVTDVQYLGSGYTKSVYKAALNRSLSVALKSVDFAGHDMENCVKKYGATGACYRLSSFKIIKEMVLMETLQHPNILKLYGYCYQDNSGIQDTVTAITELGGPLEMIHLLQTPWEERFRICLSLVRLLLFLSRSPLGSVSLLDFRPRQFVLVNGELKVTDLDDASVHEAPCVLLTAHQCTLQFPARNFSLPCTRGRCEGINEKRNLYNAYRFFFTYLLPHSAPSSLRPLLDRIVNATGELLWGVEETLSKMEEVLQLYRTGVYLQNDTRHNAADYKEAWDTSIPGQDLRCWPSYQHDACLLAVFSLKEAVSVCERHAHCGAFVFTNRTTWTGHNLVYFKSGWTGLSQASGQRTYIRLGS